MHLTKSKLSRASLFMLIFTLIFSMFSGAASAAPLPSKITFSLTSDKTGTLHPGDEVSFTASLKDVDTVAPMGLNEVYFKVNYDVDVFDISDYTITSTGFLAYNSKYVKIGAGIDPWNVGIPVSDGSITFYFMPDSEIPSNISDYITFKLKVKSDLTAVQASNLSISPTKITTAYGGSVQGIGTSYTASIGPAGPTVSALTINSSSSLVTVGDTLSLAAKATYDDNSEQAVSSQAVWSSSHAGVATVSNTGVVTGVAAGTATITATFGGKSASYDVAVNPIVPILSSISLSPSTLTLKEGDTGTISATAHYSNVPDTLVTQLASWSSSNTNVATVASGGNIVALKAGVTTITANFEGKTDTLDVVVEPTFVGLWVNSANVTLQTGSNHPISVEEVYSDNSHKSIPSTTPTYTSSDEQVATVSNQGVIVAEGAGTATISVQYKNLPALDITVTVQDEPVVPTLLSLSATPGTHTLQVGQTASSTVKGLYSDTSTTDVTDRVTWSSSNTSVATVSSAGVITPVAPSNGPVSIVASFGGKSVSIPLVVTAAPEPTLTSISTAPASISLEVGKTQALTISGHYSDTTVKPIVSGITFTSHNTAVATVSAGGTITAVGVGTTSLQVTVGTFNVELPVTVTAAPGGTDGPTTPELPRTTVPPTTTAPPVTPPLVKPPVVIDNEKVNSDNAYAVFDRERTAPAVSFTDVPANSWSAPAIERAAKMGFVAGYGDGTFKPNGAVTRAEFATMVARAFALDPKGGSSFPDTQGSFAAGSIEALRALGAINGYSDGKFHPEKEISRAEMVAILARLTTYTPGKAGQFSDVTSDWASDQINAFASAGIISGKGNGTFVPKASTTRAEAVTVLVYLLDMFFAKR